MRITTTATAVTMAWGGLALMMALAALSATTLLLTTQTPTPATATTSFTIPGLAGCTTQGCFANVCPLGWDYFNGRCYQYQSTPMDWTSASGFCTSLPTPQPTLQARLVDIRNAAENAFVNNYCANNSFVPPTTHRSWCTPSPAPAPAAGPSNPPTCRTPSARSPTATTHS